VVRFLDGCDYQPPNNIRSPQWDYPPHLDFWTDGTDWVDAPEAIDNADELELSVQAMSPIERRKSRLRSRQAARSFPFMNDLIIEVSPRYEAFAYLQDREHRKRMAAERRRIPYRPKKERPIVRQLREGLEREFAWAVEARKKADEEQRQHRDPDNDTKRALAPHLSPQNMRTSEIEERIVAMSEAEWRYLLELVPPSAVKDYRRIREDLLAKQSGNASNQTDRG
jgi:hypothetical protein